jgi:uncharacterized protein YdeI (YjbR/CyaY-like superfamily)
VALKDFESVQVRTRAEWREWLQSNHTQTQGIWMVTFKKSSGEPQVTYAEIVEEALCFGWIDSRAGTVDENRTKLMLSPRRSGSAWSKLNKERVARLIDAGLMTQAGLAKIDEAKRDGAWSALDEVDAMTIPPDLASAFDAAPAEACTHWDRFSPSSRRMILNWIRQAKRPETRARRIAETVELAGRNIRATFPADRA